MKKKVAFVVILTGIIMLVSCNNVKTLPEITSTVATSVATVDSNVIEMTTVSTVSSTTMSTIASVPSETAETVGTEGTVATTSTPASTIDPLTLAPVGDYTNLRKQIKFAGFTEYNKSWRINKNDPNSTERGVSHINKGNPKTNFLIVTVLGYGGAQEIGRFTYNVYYVNVERYGEGCIDDTVYKMAYTAPESLYCGYERLEIGRKYLVLDETQTYKNEKLGILMTSNIVLRLDKIDGEMYVYNHLRLIEFTHLNCAIKITDETENLVYRPGEDDDVISYMKQHGIKAPTYVYKCKLDEYVDELSNYEVFNIKDIEPIGEYTCIREQVPFESFAELPTRLRKTADNPYILKKRGNILDHVKYGSTYDIIYVCIAGYIGEEIGEDGIVYSYYYVYADLEHELNALITPSRFHNKKVYIMKAYGSPAHPYYGQQRYEIGDVLIRLETDLDELHNGNTLSPTSLFLIDSTKQYSHLTYAYPDFNCGYDISSKTNSSSVSEKTLYNEGRDDDIIEFIIENGLEIPKVDKTGRLQPSAIEAILTDQMKWG